MVGHTLLNGTTITLNRPATAWDRRLSLLLIAWAGYIFWMAWKLPIEARPTGDTAAYLELATYRPPVYGWFLHAYQLANGSLDHLPLVQLIIFATALLFFTIELGKLFRSTIIAAVAMALTALHVSIHEAPMMMMSESTFESLILAGLALQFRFARLDRAVDVIAAATCFSLAAATRTSGTALLLIPLATSYFDRNRNHAVALLRAAQSALAIGLVLVGIMSANFYRDGHFAIGSWTGISLLGKALLLVEPSDMAGLPPAVAHVVPAAATARARISQQTDLLGRLRAQDQAYQDLRFPIFYPAAEQTWPAWAATGWQGRGELALALSKQIILRHPAAYVGLWAHDWLALVTYPGFWPKWATADADGSLFPACQLHQNCWVLQRDDIPARSLLAMLGISILGTAGAVAVLLLCSWSVLRRRATATTTLCWAVAAVLQATLLGTAAFEAGLTRYTDITHLLGLTLVAWFASLLLARAPLRSWRRPAFGGLAAPLAAPLLREFRASGMYLFGIVIGVALFWLCTLGGLLNSIGILFYRGLSLVILAALLHVLVVTILAWQLNRRNARLTFGSGQILPIVLTGIALNLAFFVLVPVNLDRSMSVFMLSWMSDHRDAPQTKDDLSAALLHVYFDADGAVDRRIAEQLSSGDIRPTENGYVLTGRGREFVAVARVIGRLFSTDRRFLYPANAEAVAALQNSAAERPDMAPRRALVPSAPAANPSRSAEARGPLYLTP